MPRTICLLFVIFSYVFAEDNPIAWMIWRGPGQQTIKTVIMVSIFITAFIVLYSFFHRLMRKKQSQQYYFARFLKTASHFSLTDSEIQRVKNLLRYSEIEEPEMILRYVPVFESSIDKEVKEILKSNPTQQQLQKENDILYSIRKKVGFHRLPEEQPLISTRNIVPGQCGSLFGRDHSRPLLQRVVVVDVNEFTFTIEAVLEKDMKVRFSAGDSLKFAFTRKNDGMYGILLQVLSVRGKGEITVGHTMDLRRNQLREHVRIEVALPLQARLIRSEQTEKADCRVGEVVSAKMVDVSGGGVCFLCEKRFFPGDMLSLKYIFDKQRQMNQWR
jgi:hypothetical protein